MKKYSDHIFYMEGNPVTDQPFVYYIRGSRYSLLADAGNSPENYQKLLRELRELSLPKPDFIALTHWHWDHTFALNTVSCPVIASDLTNAKLKEVMLWSWDEESMRKRLTTGEDIQFCYDCIHAQYEDPTEIRVRCADITFSETMTIDLGEITCILEHRDSPHSRDSVLIHIPEEEVLIGGDAHYGDYYCNEGFYDQKRLDSFLAYLKEKPFRTYLKGHDSPSLTKEELFRELSLAEVR
ncbi:MAG: MBL fold metallo-hydrolase [Solobacterium sp.]|nr:MBL fold metallo-hydrolase [Solobacterium sp.]